MALASLPYKWKLTARQLTAANSITLSVTVTDSAGATRRTSQVQLANTASYADVETAIRGEIDAAMVADAGGRLAFVDALIAAGTLMVV